MRFIDNFSLFDLTNYMTEKEFGLCVLNGKLEAFSLIKPPLVNLVEDILVKKEAGSHCCAIHPTLSSSTDATFRKHQSEVTASSTKKVICKSAGKVKNRIPFCRPAMHPPRSRSNTVSIHNYPIRKTLRGRAASLGDLSEPSSRRLLYDLISTLDDFFPDYDFDTTKPEQFLIKDVNQLIQTVNGHLAELTEDRPDFLEKLWRSVDDIINLRKCEAFSLVPDMSEDPFSDGTLWSFNYFLFNHDMKQLIYFTCVAKR